MGALKEALEAGGITVATYTGLDTRDTRNQNKEAFLRVRADGPDVLIGSQAIATGVDGLQDVCHTMVVNLLPMTHAGWKQLRGRLYRSGQNTQVEIFVPFA